jgi:hypothetical protein
MRRPARCFTVIAALAVAVPRDGSAQAVTLRIKPHVGDTLRMRLDQESEMTGVRKMTTGGEGSAMVLTTMRMFSRAIVEGASEQGTTVLAVTDSILTSSTDEKTQAATLQAQSKMRGQRVRFRVSPDGMVAMLQDTGPAPREVAQVVSLMPTTFPKGAINVGESWMRDMALPVGNGLGAQVAGRLHVTFRLDSVSRGAELAFVSMRGEMQPASGPGAASEAVLEKGLVNGTMVIDQKRGWLAESWFSIAMNSAMSLPPSTGVLSMRMQMRITQHMHTLDKR